MFYLENELIQIKVLEAFTWIIIYSFYIPHEQFECVNPCNTSVYDSEDFKNSQKNDYIGKVLSAQEI